jgi:hypothetical protein
VQIRHLVAPSAVQTLLSINIDNFPSKNFPYPVADPVVVKAYDFFNRLQNTSTASSSTASKSPQLPPSSRLQVHADTSTSIDVLNQLNESFDIVFDQWSNAHIGACFNEIRSHMESIDANLFAQSLEKFVVMSPSSYPNPAAFDHRHFFVPQGCSWHEAGLSIEHQWFFVGSPFFESKQVQVGTAICGSGFSLQTATDFLADRSQNENSLFAFASFFFKNFFNCNIKPSVFFFCRRMISFEGVCNVLPGRIKSVCAWMNGSSLIVSRSVVCVSMTEPSVCPKNIHLIDCPPKLSFMDLHCLCQSHGIILLLTQLVLKPQLPSAMHHLLRRNMPLFTFCLSSQATASVQPNFNRTEESCFPDVRLFKRIVIKFNDSTASVDFKLVWIIPDKHIPDDDNDDSDDIFIRLSSIQTG